MVCAFVSLQYMVRPSGLQAKPLETVTSPDRRDSRPES